MKKYEYFLPSYAMWTSFDYGTVEANSLEEARKKAIEEVKYKLSKVNEVLNTADVTQGYKIEMDLSNLEVIEQ